MENIVHTPLSVIILTKNEENQIVKCLEQLNWADELLVVDSHSTDRTAHFAQSAGARVELMKWNGWARQRNAASALASHEWVMHVDADERLSRTTIAAIQRLMVGGPPDNHRYAIDRREVLLERVMPQAQRKSRLYSRVRLYNRQFDEWDETMLVHERVIGPSATYLLPGYVLHLRKETIPKLVERLGRYAALDGKVLTRLGLRNLSVRLFLTPLARFLFIYLGRSAYKQGLAGWIYAKHRANADFYAIATAIEETKNEEAKPSREL